MRDKVKELGLHLTVMLHKAGADDQAYEEIIDSLKRAKERAKNAPEDSPETPEEQPPQGTKRTMDVTSMKLIVGGA